jgi:hypothetical protein
MNMMFKNASSLTSVHLPDTGKVKYMSSMFYGATNLTSVYLPETGAVEYMNSMFLGATNLTSVHLPNTGQVTTMRTMFYRATSLTSVHLPETGAVTDMYGMFYDATSLTSVHLPETGAVTDMDAMFKGATSLTSVHLPETGAVKYMNSMFEGATNLTSVHLPETGSVTDMQLMFESNRSLTSVHLPNTGQVTDMTSMFSGATSLRSVHLPETGRVTDMAGMFLGATSLTFVDLPKTGGVKDMSRLFQDAAIFNQDIRLSLDVSGVQTFTKMFKNASKMIEGFKSTPNWPKDNETPDKSWFMEEPLVLPVIEKVSVNNDNSELRVEFNEPVYTKLNSSLNDLVAKDFKIQTRGGQAIVSETPIAVTKETARVYILEVGISGRADGSEIVTVSPASSNLVYDVARNAMSVEQSDNEVNLIDKSRLESSEEVLLGLTGSLLGNVLSNQVSFKGLCKPDRSIEDKSHVEREKQSQKAVKVFKRSKRNEILRKSIFSGLSGGLLAELTNRTTSKNAKVLNVIATSAVASPLVEYNKSI